MQAPTGEHRSLWSVDFWFQIFRQGLFPSVGLGNRLPLRLDRVELQREEWAVRLQEGKAEQRGTTCWSQGRATTGFTLSSRKLAKPQHSFPEFHSFHKHSPGCSVLQIRR